VTQPADKGTSVEYGGHPDAIGSILSDLRSAMHRIQATIRFSESAASIATLNNQETGDDFFILDDVTPRAVMASGNLNACHIALGEAILHLLEANASIVAPRTDRRRLST
jgi:hypothetical protein